MDDFYGRVIPLLHMNPWLTVHEAQTERADNLQSFSFTKDNNSTVNNKSPSNKSYAREMNYEY